MSDEVAVDLLHNVELTAGRPRNTVVDAVTEQPESGPDASLLVSAVGAKGQRRLDPRLLTLSRGYVVFGLNLARGPRPVLLLREDLEGTRAREPDVVGLSCVRLGLAVDVRIAVRDDPVASAGRGALGPGEVVGPDLFVAIIVWHASGRNQAAKEREKNSLGKHCNLEKREKMTKKIEPGAKVRRSRVAGLYVFG